MDGVSFVDAVPPFLFIPLLKADCFKTAVKGRAYSKRYGFIGHLNLETASI